MHTRMRGRLLGGVNSASVRLADRRLFLTHLAALGGAAVSVPGLNFVIAAEVPQNSAQGPAPTAPAGGGRGRVQQVGGEIKEYKDPKTGARVRRLTGDGSGNVHPYFTSWAFVGDDADRTVFASNRSGLTSGTCWTSRPRAWCS